MFKALLQLANFTLGPDATLNTETHKNSVRIKAPNSVSASKRKHKNQINHYNKQRRVLMANSTVCQSKKSLPVHSFNGVIISSARVCTLQSPFVFLFLVILIYTSLNVRYLLVSYPVYNNFLLYVSLDLY